MVSKSDYPYNLLEAVYGDNKHRYIYYCHIPAFECSLSQLMPREQEVLIGRYKDRMTLKACGEKLGATQECVRQIEARALRKLRSPALSRRWILIDGDKYREACAERDKLKLENITLKDRLGKVYAAVGVKMEEPKKESKKEILLEDLELSVRSWKCLARAGFRKLSDLEGISMEDLMKVRNLGRKSIEEIVGKLHEYGMNVN